ncbi:MAG TPA: DUF1428 domain-containing protein [Allosphingosinicella sp.]|jgi:uncharacterized protein YbaA (DUF1428 family)
MTYVEGFICAVPRANREEYRRHAAGAFAIFEELGLRRHVEAWASDVPEGKITDFRKAVQAKEDEDVVFAWFEHDSREARDAFNAKMMSDPRMEQVGASMPFDAKRMIFGGFAAMLDTGAPGGGYVDGLVLPVPAENREAYLRLAEKAASDFAGHGAHRLVEAWGDDVPDGKVTDFRRSVEAEEGENVVFSWVEWPDKTVRDSAWAKMMADPDRQRDQGEMPFDGKRMFWGGFEIILDSKAGIGLEAAEREPA